MRLSHGAEAGTLLIVETPSENSSINIIPLKKALSLLEFKSEFVSGIEGWRGRVDTSSLSALIISNWQPNAEGLEMLAYVRNGFPDLPVLVSGLSDCADASITAYENGADHYIMPPLRAREIVARLNRLLQRHPYADNFISIADLQVWTGSRVAFRSGQPIRLSSKEMELLVYLAANKSSPVSRTQILKAVFGMEFEPGTNIVEVQIHRLRQKIDQGHTQRLLNTIRGIGYVLG